MKKSKGVTNFQTALIVIVSICCIYVFYIYNMVPLVVKLQAETITRKAMFKMEQEGMITASYRADLKRKLEEKGCKNVVISGTSSKVSYGQDIYLKIQYDRIEKTFGFDGGFLPKLIDKVEKVEIPKETVSKCTS